MLQEIISNLTETIAINDLCSKVEGRRNWVIRFEKNYTGKYHILYKGAFGIAYDRGLLTEYLTYLAEHKTKWIYFTYKKDYLKALEALKNLGIKQAHLRLWMIRC